MRLHAATIAGLLLFDIAGNAQFTPGRLVILQTTTSSLNTGVPYTLREVSTTGVFGFTLTVPTTGSQQMWSDSDPQRPDLNLSEEGDRLLFPGYAAESISTNPPFPAPVLVGTSGTVCPRAVGQVDANGTFTRLVTSSTLFSGTRPTALASVGGTIWGSSLSSAAGVGVWAPGTPTVIYSEAGSSLYYNVDVHNGQLFTVRHATNKGIYRVGTGLPVTSGQNLSAELEEPGEVTVVFDHKFNSVGDICYVATASAAAGIQKWVRSNGQWTVAYTFQLVPGASTYKCIEVDWSGPNPVLFGLGGGNPMALHRFVDIGGPSSGTVIASPSGSERWTGLSWAPVSTCVEGTPCNDNDPNTTNDAIRADCQCAGQSLALNARVFLEGPYNAVTGLMNDALRTLPDFPLNEPFTLLGLNPSGGAGTIDASVLTTTGNNAIVDWVLVELRDAVTPTTVHLRTPALVQRDGDIVALDGTSTLQLPANEGDYRVAVRHRNHLGTMTAATVTLTEVALPVDFTSAATATWGINGRKTIGSARVLWSGETLRNAQLAYTGSANDRDPVLVAVGSTAPNNTVTGYRVQDVNMNGITAYVGTGNDRDPILVNVGSTAPNNIRVEQLP